MKISIRRKIVQSFCVLILILLVTQLGFNIFLSKNVFVANNKQQVEKLYQQIVLGYSDDVDVLYGITKDADTTLGYSIQVLSDTNVIYSSRTMGSGMGKENRQDIPIIIPNTTLGYMRPEGHLGNDPEHGGFKAGIHTYDRSEYSESPIVDILTNEGSDIEVLTLRGKIYYEGNARYINIAYPMESITNSILLFTKSSFWISIVVLLLGVLVVIEIANSITKPIKSMQQVSENLANLDFSHKVDEQVSTNELTGLAVSINSMSTQLEASMKKLQVANIELQKDVERQKELDTMRKQFVANVSHEMKTPLALVQIYCDNLKHNVEGIDREKYCDIIIEETQRLNKIVGDMLSVSRLENELLQPYKVELDFSELVGNLLVTMKPLMKDYKVKVCIVPDLKVRGDKAQLEEAIRNYIMNAIGHTEKGGVIKIKMLESSGQVLFSVYNEGEHIGGVDMARLWESFYKSDDSRTRVDEANAGLGLYVVKLTIDNHKGSYGVENVEGGVKFYFSLPVFNQ